MSYYNSMFNLVRYMFDNKVPHITTIIGIDRTSDEFSVKLSSLEWLIFKMSDSEGYLNTTFLMGNSPTKISYQDFERLSDILQYHEYCYLTYGYDYDISLLDVYFSLDKVYPFPTYIRPYDNVVVHADTGIEAEIYKNIIDFKKNKIGDML